MTRCVLRGDRFCHWSTLGLSSRGHFKWREKNPAQTVDSQSRWVKLVCAESHPQSQDAHRKHIHYSFPAEIFFFFFLMHLWMLMKKSAKTRTKQITNLCRSSREAKQNKKTAWAEEGKHVVAWIATPGKKKTAENFAICQVTVASVKCLLLFVIV